MFKWFVILLILISQGLGAEEGIPAAGRIVNGTIFFYNSLHEAIADANGTSPEAPDEITLLSDITVYAPIIIEDNQHIALIAGGGDRTIMRGADFLEYPVIWIRGENSSLTLGSAGGGTGLEVQGTASGIYELVIDGGFSHGIEAHSPLVAINGPDSSLIMHDNVFLQNNFNSGPGLAPGSYFNNGAGVYLRTSQDNLSRPVQFIMKGGTIRGNTNNVQHTLSYGGGVRVSSGIFTMEGGKIMGNSANIQGGGVDITNSAVFKKTGGIIYGINAAEDQRNIAVYFQGANPRGHAIMIGDIGSSVFRFRNDTVGENETLTFTGLPTGDGFFGRGEKWQDRYTALRRNLFAAGVLLVMAAGVFIFVFMRKRAAAAVTAQGETAVQNKQALTDIHFSPREKEVLDLLLKGLSFRDISNELHLSISGVKHHSQHIYRKLGIQSRTELLVKFK